MARTVPESHLNAVIDVIAKSAAGCTPAEVRAALKPPPPRRNLQRWLSGLVRGRRLIRIGSAKATRYRIARPGELPDELAPASESLPVAKNSAAEAMLRLVTRPLTERLPAVYHREWLDAYQPNKTRYLPFKLIPLLREGAGVIDGAAQLKDPAFIERFTQQTAHAALCLEGMTVTPATVMAFLQQEPPAKPGSRAMQFAWNQRAAVKRLAEQIGACALGGRALVELSDTVEEGFFARDELGEPVFPDALRRGPLMALDLGGKVLPAPDSRSSYQPPQDPMLIRACFEQLANLAVEIREPFEQAFFLFVHLLYLQPFTFNLSTACLAANQALVRAKLQPIAFGTIPACDFRAGVAALCELNQLDLIREVFLYGYFDGVALPRGHPYGRGV